MTPHWTGVFPAVTTQFKRDESLDLDGTMRHVEALLESGVQGLIMLGSLAAWKLPSLAEGSSAALPRSTPEEQGVSSSNILAFIDAMKSAKHELHSFMMLRHGQVIAEGWWDPYSPEYIHTMYSMSKSFTSTAVGLAVAAAVVGDAAKALAEIGDLRLVGARMDDRPRRHEHHRHLPPARVAAAVEWKCAVTR